MMVIRHYSEEFKQQARELHASGTSLREVARRCGASFSTVRLWCDPDAVIKSRKWHEKYRSEPGYKDKARAYHKEWYNENGNKKREKNKEWKELNPKRYWAAMAIITARKRSAKAGVPFNITVDDVLSVFPVNDKCPVFGVKLIPFNGLENRWHSPSLDRIIPEKGYVVDNIAVISLKANTLKGNGTVTELKRVVKWLEQITA